MDLGKKHTFLVVIGGPDCGRASHDGTARPSCFGEHARRATRVPAVAFCVDTVRPKATGLRNGAYGIYAVSLKCRVTRETCAHTLCRGVLAEGCRPDLNGGPTD